MERRPVAAPVLDTAGVDDAALAPEPALAPLPWAADAPASLVVQTSFLGDMVLTTPLIARLARRGPVDVVATPASAPILANNPSVRDVVAYDKRGDARGMFGLYRASRTLTHRQDDGGASAPRRAAAAYMAQGSMRSAMLAMLGGVPERVGFDTSAGRALYTRIVRYLEDRHHAERLWRLASEGTEQPTSGDLRPRLFPGSDEVGAVDDFLASRGHASEPVVALAPGSVWATKRWPFYAALAQMLVLRGARVAIVGGVVDAPLARAIRDGAGEAAMDATGQLSLLGSAELIGRCVALVTNDSAPQHLASAMSTPTVTLFGPTVPDFGFGPLAPGSRALGRDGLACRPCDRHGPATCPLGHWRCMRELEPAAVAEAVTAIAATRG